MLKHRCCPHSKGLAWLPCCCYSCRHSASETEVPHDRSPHIFTIPELCSSPLPCDQRTFPGIFLEKKLNDWAQASWPEEREKWTRIKTVLLKHPPTITVENKAAFSPARTLSLWLQSSPEWLCGHYNIITIYWVIWIPGFYLVLYVADVCTSISLQLKKIETY